MNTLTSEGSSRQGLWRTQKLVTLPSSEHSILKLTTDQTQLQLNTTPAKRGVLLFWWLVVVVACSLTERYLGLSAQEKAAQQDSQLQPEEACMPTGAQLQLKNTGNMKRKDNDSSNKFTKPRSLSGWMPGKELKSPACKTMSGFMMFKRADKWNNSIQEVKKKPNNMDNKSRKDVETN